MLWLEDGYDVWLGNNRGSKYSLDHEDLKWNNNNDYWKFSFQDMGRYDLKGIVNKINEVRQEEFGESL